MEIKESDSNLWPIAAGLVVLVVASGGRKAAEKAWEKKLDRPVPRKASAPLRDALLWSVLSGVLVSLLRVFTARGLDRVRTRIE